jgi:hypothetical protein
MPTLDLALQTRLLAVLLRLVVLHPVLEQAVRGVVVREVFFGLESVL